MEQTETEWNEKKSALNTETEFLNTERLKSGIKKLIDENGKLNLCKRPNDFFSSTYIFKFFFLNK